MGNLIDYSKRLLSDTASAYSRISSFFHVNRALHKARFAKYHELSGLLSHVPKSQPTLLIGEDHFNQIYRVRPVPNRRELGNILVDATTRGGKGLLAVSQLLTWPNSVVVNDIKGDLFTQTAGYRSSLGPVLVIDPTGNGHSYDPLSGRQTEDALGSTATQLLYKADERDPIFTQRATNMLTQMFLAARAEGHPPLPYVRSLIRGGLVASAARLHVLSPELSTQFLGVDYEHADLSGRFLESAWGTLDSRLRPLLTETVVRSLAVSDFQPADLITAAKPVTVYLRWPERDLLALSPLVRIVWGSIIDELITTYDIRRGQNCAPVLLLIDEAGRTAIPSLADHATTVVGRGISLWVSVQSLSQLETVYGRARATTIMDNMETQLYYRPGSHDSAERLQRNLDQTSQFAHSQTMRDGQHTSQGLSEQAVPLMSAWELRQLLDHEIIGFHRNLPPFKARRMDWRRFPELVKHQKIPPPALNKLPAVERLIERKEIPPPTYFDPNELEKEMVLLV